MVCLHSFGLGQAGAVYDSEAWREQLADEAAHTAAHAAAVVNGTRATRTRLFLFDVPCRCGQARGASGHGRNSHRGSEVSQRAAAAARAFRVCDIRARLHQCATPLSTQSEWAASWQNEGHTVPSIRGRQGCQLHLAMTSALRWCAPDSRSCPCDAMRTLQLKPKLAVAPTARAQPGTALATRKHGLAHTTRARCGDSKHEYSQSRQSH